MHSQTQYKHCDVETEVSRSLKSSVECIFMF